MPVIPGFHIFERLRKEELAEFFPNTSGLLSQGREAFKGTVSRDFRPSVFCHETLPPGHLIHGLTPF
jgi:hypothetical protein